MAKLEAEIELLGPNNDESVSNMFEALLLDFSMYKETLAQLEGEKGPSVNTDTKNSFYSFLGVVISFFAVYLTLNTCNVFIKKQEA